MKWSARSVYNEDMTWANDVVQMNDEPLSEHALGVWGRSAPTMLSKNMTMWR